MTPSDKQKIKDAFNAAVNASPYADEIVPGMATREGAPITRRQLVEWTVNNEQFYEQVDKLVASGKVTVDELIEKFGTAQKTSIHRGPRP